MQNLTAQPLTALGIDPGKKPGYCSLLPGSPAYLTTAQPFLHPPRPWDIAACESQFVAPGETSRRRQSTRIATGGIITLAQIAGAQLAAAPAKLKLMLPYSVWTGALWANAGARLDAEVAIGYLRDWLVIRIGHNNAQAATEDEVVSFGVALAALEIGDAKSGTLKNGQHWKRIKQPLWFTVKIVQPAKAAGRKFGKGLRAAGFK